jgi:hypothetical protein
MDKISKIEYLQDRPVNPYLKFLKVSTDNWFLPISNATSVFWIIFSYLSSY